jgi:hypothetical protein
MGSTAPELRGAVDLSTPAVAVRGRHGRGGPARSQSRGVGEADRRACSGGDGHSTALIE